MTLRTDSRQVKPGTGDHADIGKGRQPDLTMLSSAIIASLLEGGFLVAYHHGCRRTGIDSKYRMTFAFKKIEASGKAIYGSMDMPFFFSLWNFPCWIFCWPSSLLIPEMANSSPRCSRHNTRFSSVPTGGLGRPSERTRRPRASSPAGPSRPRTLPGTWRPPSCVPGL